MKRYQIIALCSIIPVMTACGQYKHLTQTQQENVRIETKTNTVYITDTVLVEIPVERERQTVKDTTSHLETSYAVSDAVINPDGSLSHSLENKAQAKPLPIDTKIVYRDSIIFKDKIIEKTIPVERELTWWQQAQMKGFWLAVLIIVIMFRKKIFAVLKRFI